MNRAAKRKPVYYLVLSAFFAALVFLFTYIVHIPVQNGGYFHFGDTMVYLAACLLPPPYAAASAAVGAALADVLSSAVLWAPASIIIKALTALCFSYTTQKFLCKRNFLAYLPATVLCAGGYYLAEVILVQSWVSPLISVPMNIAQPVVSLILFTLLGAVLDKVGFKGRFFQQSARWSRPAA